MKIDRKLNLVIPIQRDSDTLLIYSMPVRKEVFDTYYLVLAKTFAAFAQNGLDPRSGPSVAALVLRDIAQNTPRGDGNLSWWDGDDGIGGKAGLLAEIVRLSTCLVGTHDKGWQTIPLQEALDKDYITAEDKAEAMSQLVFFTVSSLVAPRQDRPILVNGMAAIYRLEVTSLSFTEWANSFKIRMRDASIIEKEKLAKASSDTTSDG